MDQSAANTFVKWFQDNGGRLALLHDEMLAALSAGKSGARQVMKVFARLEKEISPLLTAVQEGLIFEVGPGRTKKHGLILSAGGVSSLIPAVEYLANELTTVSEWDVIAFKPAREIGEAAQQIIMTSLGEKHVAPSDVLVSLHPELTKVGVRLYFSDYKQEDYQSWGQVGFNFLDFSLGEYVVMESIGEISFHSTNEAPKDAFSISSLKAKFDEAVEKTRTLFTELSQTSQLNRLEQSLCVIERDVSKIMESVNESVDEEFNFSLYFWVENAEYERALKNAFSDFDVSTTPKLATIGSGHEVALSGAVQRQAFDLREWLRHKLGGVKEFVLLTAIHEPEPVNPMMAQFVALKLIEDKRFDEATKMLKSALRGVGGDDDGQLHGLLAMAYLEGGKNQEAAETYDKALKIAQDDEMRGEILNNKGSALQRSGRLDDALLCFEQALKLDEENYSRQYNVGQAYAQKGLAEKACLHLGRALQAKSDLKDHMLNDPDLASIRDTDNFKMMLEQFCKPGLFGRLFSRKNK